MSRKIKKHTQIIKRRLNSKTAERKLKQVNNQYLTSIYQAILDSKNEKFSQQDLANFEVCENHRKLLLSNNEIVTYEIFGLDRTAIVKDVCAKAASSRRWCRLIYSLVKATNSEKVFEIGTNLGVSGTYILSALLGKKNRSFVSLEGLNQFCEIAAEGFAKIDSKDNFKICQGLYDKTFDQAISSVEKIDCGFIDGYHQYEPTLEYFHKMEPLILDRGVLLFDDINWTDQMRKVWDEIKQSPKVNFSIDLFEIGIAIIDRNYKGDKASFAFHYDY